MKIHHQPSSAQTNIILNTSRLILPRGILWIEKILFAHQSVSLSFCLFSDQINDLKRREKHLSTSNIVGYALSHWARKLEENEGEMQNNKKTVCIKEKRPANDAFTRHSSGFENTWRNVNATHQQRVDSWLSTLLARSLSLYVNKIDATALFFPLLELLFKTNRMRRSLEAISRWMAKFYISHHLNQQCNELRDTVHLSDSRTNKKGKLLLC